MDFDGLSMRACLRALRRQAAGARIRHITQPSELSLAIEFRAGGRPLWVVCSAEPEAACVFCTLEPPGAAIAPSPFCSMLRRHLGGLRLVDAPQEGWDRVGRLELAGQDELGAATSYSLVVEVMGKHSNIICVREDGRILDAIKRIGRSKSRVRQVLPGRPYELPPGQTKLSPDTVTGGQLATAVSSAETPAAKRTGPADLVRVVAGVGPSRAKDIWKAAATASDAGLGGGGGGGNAAGRWDRVAESVRLAAQLADEDGEADGTNAPCSETAARFREYLALAPGGQPHPDAHGQGSRTEPRDGADALQARLAAQVAAAARSERERHAALKAQAAASEEAELWLRRGNALLGSLGLVREMLAASPPSPGRLLSLDLPDHQEPEPDAPGGRPGGSPAGGQAMVRVELQPGEEPARAAQRCLARYAQLRRSYEKLESLLAGSATRLDHLGQLVFQLKQQPLSAQEVAEVAEEMARAGIGAAQHGSAAGGRPAARLKGRHAGTPAGQQSLPISLRSPGGFEVLVGRNNRQNDGLLRRGAPDDLWFHARGVPGAHVLLRRAGRPGKVPDADVTFAAGLAAGHSQAAQASSTPVDYTELRLVRRGKGAVPGFVTYTGEKTLSVRPFRLDP